MEAALPGEIFSRLKALVAPYSKEMEIITDTAILYELRIPKEFMIGDRHYQECYYCSLLMTTHSVSFSLITYKLFAEEFSVPTALRKNLRANGRFNFRKLDNVQEAAVAQLLRKGFDLYKSRLS